MLYLPIGFMRDASRAVKRTCKEQFTKDGVGPFGAKGIGEPSMVSIAPAVANAVCDATGVRVFDLPLTPEKIVKALKSI